MGNKRNQNRNKDDAHFKGQRSRNMLLRKIAGLKNQAALIFQKIYRMRNVGIESFDRKHGENVVKNLAKNSPTQFQQRLVFWQGVLLDAEHELNSLKSSQAGVPDAPEGGGRPFSS